MDEQDLVENVYDSIAAARNTIRVSHTKPATEDGETFFCSFLMNVDTKTLAALRAEAEKATAQCSKAIETLSHFGFSRLL